MRLLLYQKKASTMREPSKKELLEKVKLNLGFKSFVKNFVHYTKNPNERVPGNSEEDRDHNERHKNYMKTKQRR